MKKISVLFLVAGSMICGQALSAAGKADWRVSCSIDKFTDKRSCMLGTLTPVNDALTIHLFPTQTLLSFGTSDDPRVPGKVRIDKNPAESGRTIYSDQAQVQRIIKQMMQGGTATVRLQKYARRIEEYELDLSDFPAAMRQLTFRMQYACPKAPGEAPPPALNLPPAIQIELDAAIAASVAEGDCKQ